MTKEVGGEKATELKTSGFSPQPVTLDSQYDGRDDTDCFRVFTATFTTRLSECTGSAFNHSGASRNNLCALLISHRAAELQKGSWLC